MLYKRDWVRTKIPKMLCNRFKRRCINTLSVRKRFVGFHDLAALSPDFHGEIEFCIKNYPRISFELSKFAMVGPNYEV